MRRVWLVSALAMVAGAAFLSMAARQRQVPQPPKSAAPLQHLQMPAPPVATQFHSYTGPMPAEDGQWLMAAKDYGNHRYSGLNQINTNNVRELKLAWSFSTGVLRGHEAAPLVVGDTMYVVTPYPNILYGLDLRHNGALKWAYHPAPDPASQGVACCDVVNRGAAYENGRIYYNTLDDHTVCVDAKTGKEIWKTRVGTIELGEAMTMAPIVVHGKVLVGNSGGELGVRGDLTALDAGSGKILWRAYSTGPDADVLIGPQFHPFYPQYRGANLGETSWPPGAWKIGGGTVWGWLSYDPQLNLVYYGTSNPGPWDASQRPGLNYFTAGIFARDPDNGEARWFYQYSPHDLFDYDAVNESILLDLPWQGQTRKVLVHPDRNGYVYLIDRTNGEVLSAHPFAPITTSTGVDLKTGELEYAKDEEPRFGVDVRGMCPAAPGAKDWQPSSFDPQTGLVYIPHNHLCMDKEDVSANYIAGTPYVGANVVMYDAPGGFGGQLTAWDPIAGRPVWQINDRFPVWSGTVATAGGLVFFGTMEGYFEAADARTGQVLWRFKAGSGIIGQPVSYRGPDGKQYIAVLSGVGGWAGAIVAGGLNPIDPTGALGFVGATQDLPKYTTNGGMLYVFSLP